MLRFIKFLIFISISFLFSNNFVSYNGQVYIVGLNQHDSTLNYDYRLNYIPEFKKKIAINTNSNVDINFSYLFFKEQNNNKVNLSKYRSWIRYYNDYIDLRLGLQKITFGSALFLKPLSWFDSIDFRSITDQTYGVDAARLILTPNNSSSYWFWIIKNKLSPNSFGGRFELSNYYGDWGFTYYKDSQFQKHLPFQINQFLFSMLSDDLVYQPNNLESILGFRENQRLGFDYRYDGFFGFWFETSKYIMKKYDDVLFNEFLFCTLGLDYTLPYNDGILISGETIFSQVDLSIESELLDNDNISSLFYFSMPINMINNLSLFHIIDWDYNIPSNNLLLLSSTYDSFTMNYMLTLIPGQFNDFFQIEFVYNY